ncbi:MAG: hypothetical protein HXS48_08830 [Theionarchaea archaeon]|nr:hypothetical protein [Theionarchaea archaeon]
MKSRIVVPVIFIAFLLSGYIIMGYARHHLYQSAIQEYTAQRIALREEGISTPMGWEDHEYLGTPEAALVVADPVFQERIYSLWDEWLNYSTEYGTDVLLSFLEEIDDNEWSLWDAYKSLTLFRYLKGTLTVASSMGLRMTPHSDLDRGGSLAESIAAWEAAGGKCEGNWFEVYEKSPEYESWLDEILDEISDPVCTSTQSFNPRTMEDLYVETKQYVELPFASCLLQKDMLETQRKMTETAYKRYLVHLAEKDIVQADIDAWVVRFGSSHFHDTVTVKYSLLHFLRIDGFPLRDLVFDTCIIVIFSAFSTFVVLIKVIPRCETKNRD